MNIKFTSVKSFPSLMHFLWATLHAVVIGLILFFAVSKSYAMGGGIGLSPPVDIHIPTFEEFPSPSGDVFSFEIEDEDGNREVVGIV